jgi:hypothetical protein
VRHLPRRQEHRRQQANDQAARWEVEVSAFVGGDAGVDALGVRQVERRLLVQHHRPLLRLCWPARPALWSGGATTASTASTASTAATATAAATATTTTATNAAAAVTSAVSIAATVAAIAGAASSTAAVAAT